MEFSLYCIHVTHATHDNGSTPTKKEHLDPLPFFASWLGALGARTTSINRLGIANTWHVTYIWRAFSTWERMDGTDEHNGVLLLAFLDNVYGIC
jgi:hypothetical protein